MEKVFASIITIGDELLIGQVIDTNSAWMAQELNKAGILVRSRIAVGDIKDDIWEALDEASEKSSLVLITGGLGPTADDITKPLLCDYFKGKMVLHEPTLQHVQALFSRVFKRTLTDRNRKQAEVPDVCTVLRNDVGTAPGMLFRKGNTLFISMPGVPHEMKWIMEHQVIPQLHSWFQTGCIEHRTLLTAGIGESYLADMITDIEKALPPHIKLAYLPSYGMVRLRLTAIDSNQKELQETIDHHFRLLVAAVKEYLVIDDDIPMELVVGNLLKERGKTLATAESCTGGYIAHKLTSHAGSSAYFMGSVVGYDNSIKQRVLDVKTATLENKGAVSEETVREMIKGILEVMKTDYAIAVSGIMGPDGGSETKPVGTVWIAVGNPSETLARKFNFRFDRMRNIELTAINALNLLRQFILQKS
jgi:nicotinamide-nucleotide amidase